MGCLPGQLMVSATGCAAPRVQGGGGNPFANMGGLMETIKKAQALVQVEAGKVQEELAR